MSDEQNRQAEGVENEDKPFVQFGPVPVGERTTLSVAIWKKDQIKGEQVIPLFSVALTKTYHVDGERRTTNKLRAHEIPAALLLLEKAERFIRDYRAGS
jgi:hypothetical protein